VGLESKDRPLLERLDAALTNPVWPLYLGRRSFVPSIPVRAGIRDAADLRAALTKEPWLKRSNREEPDAAGLRIVLECGVAEDGEVRRDVPRSFDSLRRSFSARRVRDAEYWAVPEEQIKEWPSCTCPV
jgi:CRISPR system Cascade subunit CasD